MSRYMQLATRPFPQGARPLASSFAFVRNAKPIGWTHGALLGNIGNTVDGFHLTTFGGGVMLPLSVDTPPAVLNIFATASSRYSAIYHGQETSLATFGSFVLREIQGMMLHYGATNTRRATVNGRYSILLELVFSFTFDRRPLLVETFLNAGIQLFIANTDLLEMDEDDTYYMPVEECIYKAAQYTAQSFFRGNQGFHTHSFMSLAATITSGYLAVLVPTATICFIASFCEDGDPHDVWEVAADERWARESSFPTTILFRGASLPLDPSCQVRNLNLLKHKTSTTPGFPAGCTNRILAFFGTPDALAATERYDEEPREKDRKRKHSET